MDTLRDQVSAIVVSEFGDAFLKAAGFSRAVTTLSERMLCQVVAGTRNACDLDVRAVVRCIDLFKSPGFVTETEPALVEGTVGRRVTSADLLRRGGNWLGAARQWLLWNTRNGNLVTWGSSQEIEPPMTAGDVDKLAAEVAASFYPEGPPPAVLEAAKAVTRWHYGEAPGQGQAAPSKCVLVAHEEWKALQRAVKEAL